MYLINDLISQKELNDDKTKNLLIEYQQSYIINWKKYKLDKFSSNIYKSWDPLAEVPKEYQLLLNFYFDFDLNKNVMGGDINEYEKAYMY